MAFEAFAAEGVLVVVAVDVLLLLVVDVLFFLLLLSPHCVAVARCCAVPHASLLPFFSKQ
jgi:hypothetical protein